MNEKVTLVDLMGLVTVGETGMSDSDKVYKCHNKVIFKLLCDCRADKQILLRDQEIFHRGGDHRVRACKQ